MELDATLEEAGMRQVQSKLRLFLRGRSWEVAVQLLLASLARRRFEETQVASVLLAAIGARASGQRRSTLEHELQSFGLPVSRPLPSETQVYFGVEAVSGFQLPLRNEGLRKVLSAWA